MQTTALPILSLIAHPEYPTRYRVNGRFVPPGATVFPLPENGEAFIEALPAAPVEGKRLVARSCAFSFRDGALMPPGAAEGMEVTLWPGNVAEVCLSPMVLPPARGRAHPKPAAPRFWQRRLSHHPAMDAGGHPFEYCRFARRPYRL